MVGRPDQSMGGGENEAVIESRVLGCCGLDAL